MTVTPKLRREGQNTGLRAKVALEVEASPCMDSNIGNHALINRNDGRTECVGCGVEWADLDAALNQRGESWLTS